MLFLPASRWVIVPAVLSKVEMYQKRDAQTTYPVDSINNVPK